MTQINNCGLQTFYVFTLAHGRISNQGQRVISRKKMLSRSHLSQQPETQRVNINSLARN